MTASSLAVSAQAATVVFNFGANPGGPSGANWGSVGPASPTASNAWDANSRIFTASIGPDTVKVRATGWSINGSTVEDSFLGGYSGSGLGVTSGDDSRGANNKHTVDNQTRKDFILLQFDRAVDLDSARFNAFSISGTGYTDTDATIGRGTTNLNWQTQPNLNGQNISALNTLIPLANRFGSGNSGTSGSNTRSFNPSNLVGNVWLISASMANNYGGDSKIDSFKLNTLQVSFLGPLPEPEVWATMIIGFGFIGAAMRRKRTLATA
jgi:hypothetical protein